MNLGQFIDRLEKLEPKDSLWIAGSPVHMRPTDFNSYRGYYEDLALGCEVGSERRLVREEIAGVGAWEITWRKDE